MLLTEDLIVKLFVLIDDFCKEYIPMWNDYLRCNKNNNGIGDKINDVISDKINSIISITDINSSKRKVYEHRKDTLSESEIITILVLHQINQGGDPEDFYEGNIKEMLLQYFPKMPSYKRFTVLESEVNALLILLSQYLSGEETGIYYIDSTPLAVCKNQRTYNHKTFNI